MMLEVTSIRNLRPREGKEALHLVFSPALFPPPPAGGLRTGGGAGFPASSALMGDTRRDRDYVTKEARGTEFFSFNQGAVSRKNFSGFQINK